MKNVILNFLFLALHGQFIPGYINRQKHFRADGANVLGRNELYGFKKRNYEKNPMTEGERQTVDRFRQAETRRKQEMQSAERAAYWEARFKAQLDRPEKGNRKSYVRKDNFIRAMLMKEMK